MSFPAVIYKHCLVAATIILLGSGCTASNPGNNDTMQLSAPEPAPGSDAVSCNPDTGESEAWITCGTV